MEALAESRYERRRGVVDFRWRNLPQEKRDRPLEDAKADLQAAAPAIRKQERERIREALLDEVTLDEAEDAYKGSHVGGRQALTRAVEAALDSLEDSG